MGPKAKKTIQKAKPNTKTVVRDIIRTNKNIRFIAKKTKINPNKALRQRRLMIQVLFNQNKIKKFNDHKGHHWILERLHDSEIGDLMSCYLSSLIYYLITRSLTS